MHSDAKHGNDQRPGSRPHLSVRPSNATLADMKNVSPTYLKHQFLIAMPHMADPNFAQTLTYIVEHTANGAMGLVVNRPQELNLADILEQLRPEIDPPARCQGVPIYFGGPVLSPMLAGAAMALSSVSVVGNALRLRFFNIR